MSHNPARGRRSQPKSKHPGPLLRTADERVTSGTNWDLEEKADAILAEGRRGIRDHSSKKDYLTEAQMWNRLSHEVYTSTGAPPDRSFVSGIFKRAYAPPRSRGPRRMSLGDDNE